MFHLLILNSVARSGARGVRLCQKGVQMASFVLHRLAFSLVFTSLLMGCSQQPTKTPKLTPQQRVESLLKSDDIPFIERNISNIPKGTPGLDRVTAHLAELIATERTPVVDAAWCISLSGKEIESALRKKYGPTRISRYDKVEAATKWYISTPRADIAVLPADGKIIELEVSFRPPARDASLALALIGVVNDVPPTDVSAVGPRWEKAFPNMEIVQGLYPSMKPACIESITVFPSKARYDKWAKQ